ncbi:hypothetical protein, partial [Moraxella catarrhalis]|uniref:hypothetical protein n=1 Tax=Moraxella catarrhalis TaxID=480 RepID=UPI001D0DAE0B
NYIIISKLYRRVRDYITPFPPLILSSKDDSALGTASYHTHRGDDIILVDDSHPIPLAVVAGASLENS